MLSTKAWMLFFVLLLLASYIPGAHGKPHAIEALQGDTVPQMTKAPPVLMQDSTCVDNPKPIAKDHEGKEMYCEDFSTYCNDATHGLEIQDHCPATCGKCGETLQLLPLQFEPFMMNTKTEDEIQQLKQSLLQHNIF